MQYEWERAKSEAPPEGPALASWIPEWLELYRPPNVGQRTFANYQEKARALSDRMGDMALVNITQAEVIALRAALEREGREPRTASDYLAVLRLILRDARINGLIDSSPFDTRLPKRDTKVTRASRNRRRVRFRPFLADELARLLDVLRVPRDRTEALYFPPTEFMLLTGLRWGECVGVLWSDLSWTGGEIHIQRAVVRGEDRTDEPTKTGEDWTIPLRPPVAQLLQVQQERSFVRRTEGRIFPGPSGGPISYTSGCAVVGVGR